VDTARRAGKFIDTSVQFANSVANALALSPRSINVYRAN